MKEKEEKVDEITLKGPVIPHTPTLIHVSRHTEDVLRFYPVQGTRFSVTHTCPSGYSLAQVPSTISRLRFFLIMP